MQSERDLLKPWVSHEDLPQTFRQRLGELAAWTQLQGVTDVSNLHPFLSLQSQPASYNNRQPPPFGYNSAGEH